MGAALPAIAIGSQIGGSLLNAFGSYQSGQAGKATANYQAQVAQNNAAIAAQEARMIEQAGFAKEANVNMKSRAQGGAITAGFAGQGVDVNSGSAAAVRTAQAQLGSLDALTTRSNTAREVYGKEVEQTSDIAQAQLDTAKGKQAETAGDIGAFSSLIGGAGSVAGQYKTWYGASGNKPTGSDVLNG